MEEGGVLRLGRQEILEDEGDELDDTVEDGQVDNL